jgi:hypothetical protein
LVNWLIGIKGLRNLRIERIISFNPSMPKCLNPSIWC